jgi:Flp pilus assembly protein TadD
VASFIGYRSEQLVKDAAVKATTGRADAATLEDLGRAGRLNPDIRRYTGEAWYRIFQGRAGAAEAKMREAASRDPDNAFVWLEWTRMRLQLGRRAAAEETYARAKELDSQLPRTPLPGG